MKWWRLIYVHIAVSWTSRYRKLKIIQKTLNWIFFFFFLISPGSESTSLIDMYFIDETSNNHCHVTVLSFS